MINSILIKSIIGPNRGTPAGPCYTLQRIQLYMFTEVLRLLKLLLSQKIKVRSSEFHL